MADVSDPAAAGSSSSTAPAAAKEWQPSDFAAYFSKRSDPTQEFSAYFAAPPPTAEKVVKTNEGSWDSTMTDFEAESASADILPCDEVAWMELKTFLAAHTGGLSSPEEEAAHKLISNHVAVLRDVTNASPHTQLQLQRVPAASAIYVDQAMRETTLRLLGHRPGVNRLHCDALDPNNGVQVTAWLGTATYLSSRIQANDHERPGRKPDMSPEVAAAMRTVLQGVWWDCWELLDELRKQSQRSRSLGKLVQAGSSRRTAGA